MRGVNSLHVFTYGTVAALVASLTNPSANHPDHPKEAPNAAAENPRLKRSPGTSINDVPGLHNGAASGI
jgi:hypothetical protein